MYRSLYFKIILIFVVLMITVMVVVGTILLNSVFNFYIDDFSEQVGNYLGNDSKLTDSIISALNEEDYVQKTDEILRGYSNFLGIDIYRNYYIMLNNKNTGAVCPCLNLIPLPQAYSQ